MTSGFGEAQQCITFQDWGPRTRHVAELVPPKKCVGPRGGVFFSADHPSLPPLSSSSYTHTLFS